MAKSTRKTHTTYEEHLDEVATLLTEIFTLSDQTAIEIVMRAQADDYFSGHDDDPTICTLERAGVDARHVFKNYSQKARARKSAKAN